MAQTTKHDGIRTAIYRRIAAIPESRTALFEQTNADPTIIVAALAEQMRTEVATDAPSSWAAFSDRVRPLAAKNPELRRQFLFLAGKFRDERVRPELRSLLADSAQSIELRTVALEALAQDPESLPVVRGLITGGASPLRQTAIVTAGNVGDDASIAAILRVLPGLEQSEQSAALSVLCGRLGSAKSLLEEVGAGRVSRNLISVVAARQMQQLGDEALNGMLSEHWGALQTSGGDAGLKIAKWKAVLTPDRLAKASAANGRLLFNQTCYACHVLYGQGNLIGPDLTGANRRDLDYLLENILNPNAVIGKDYQLHVLYLRDGEVVAGMARGESASALTLILPGGVERSVSKDAITRRELLAQSLMPEGLLDALPEADAVDLIAYLRSETQVPVARPGETVFEGEDLTVTEATGGKTSKQPMGGFKADTWSGNSQLWWTGNQPGNRLSLGFQVSEAGAYALSVVLTKAPDYAQVRIWLDNNIELIRSIDLYDPAVRTTGVIELGTHSLSPGTHQLRFDILDKNAKALPRYMVGIDSLMLLKK